MAQASSAVRWGPFIWTVIIVIIILFVWCWTLPKWCPCRWICPDGQCPEGQECQEPASGAAAQIVLEDTHSASWMVFDNRWIKDLGANPVCKTPGGDGLGLCGSLPSSYEGNDYRAGVLFQIGTLDKKDGGTADHFDKITLKFADTTTKTFNETNFDWLDINATGKCPIDASHAYSLFINDVVTPGCGPPNYGNSCLRNGALHASLRADVGLVTYWPSTKNYTIEAGIVPESEHDHIGYVFSLLDPVTVDHWFKGCFVDRYEGVTEIRIEYIEDSSQNYDFDEPPMDGR